MGKLRRWWLAGVVSVIDVAIVATSVWIAAGLKWDEWSLALIGPVVFDVAVIMVPVSIVIFWGFGLYRGSWKLASVDDFVRSAQAAAATGLAGGTLMWLLPVDAPAIGFFLLYGLVLMLVVTSSRASVRIIVRLLERRSVRGRPVLIYGAGWNGLMALREMLTNQDLDMRPVGFIDDNPDKVGRQIQGYPVLGPVEELDLESTPATMAVVSSWSIPAWRVAKLRSLCNAHHIELRSFSILLEELPRRSEVEPLESLRDQLSS